MKITLLFISFLLISSCATYTKNLSDYKATSLENIFTDKYSGSEQNYNILLTRDFGITGSIQRFGISINGEKVIALWSGEKSLLKVPPGKYIFGLGPYNSANPKFEAVTEQEIEITNEKITMRISIFPSGEIKLQRTAQIK